MVSGMRWDCWLGDELWQERQCRAGCRGQQAATLQMQVGAPCIFQFHDETQAQFPHTSHQLLLGSALDKCWDGKHKISKKLNKSHQDVERRPPAPLAVTP